MFCPNLSHGPLIVADINVVLSAIEPILSDCLRRVRSWPIPWNWSRADWFDEAKGVATIAALQAGFSHRLLAPPAMFATFVGQRIMSSTRTRYRQEFLFGLRFCGRLAEERLDFDEQTETPRIELNGIESIVEPIGAHGDLRDALNKLSANHRTVIEQLFWQGKSETELAESLGISQRGVSKRKQAALRILKEQLLEK